MIGADRTTGKPLGGEAHLAQSIRDILTTPVGSRVMRRDYGSDIPDLMDAPLNGATIVDFYAAVAKALDRWEPRVKLTRIVLIEAVEGAIEVELQGDYVGRALDTGVISEGLLQ